jgi:carbon monoxide dehydrogenase subunit G
LQLAHTFSVPVDVDQAWQVLLDIERVAPCMPGAVLDSVDGDDFTGSVKVRLGPIGLTYKGKASFVEKDESTHRVVIDAQGRDARGNGTASAKVTATLVPEGAATKVIVETDLNITGKPAQFGRGVMVDVGNKLIGQFADCLAGKLGETSEAAGVVSDAEVSNPPSSALLTSVEAGGGSLAASPGGSPAPAASRTPGTMPTVGDDVQPINLLQSAGPALVKRLVPLLVIAVVVIAVLHRRSRHHR